MNFQDNLQAMVCVWEIEHQKERAKEQMTLGKFISILEELPPDRPISGIKAKLNSYRGYYNDLAFEPATEDHYKTVSVILEAAKKCMGRTFEGYKGGDYVMHENTPLWLARWGDTGLRIMDVNDEEQVLTFVLAEEEY